MTAIYIMKFFGLFYTSFRELQHATAIRANDL